MMELAGATIIVCSLCVQDEMVGPEPNPKKPTFQADIGQGSAFR